MSEQEKKAKPLRCTVTSDKMDKSRVAKVARLIKHERYGKFLRRSTKVMFHDEGNASKIGDEVLVKVSRPFSSRKKFELMEIVKKAED